MKLGIYIGSFNPVHEGHIKVANYLIDNKIVDRIIMLPTPNYWHKQNLQSETDRVNMLKFYENKNIIVDNIHNKYVYTYELLESISRDYPNDELYLVLGSDSFETLHMWKNIDIILKYNIIVLKRGNKDIRMTIKNYDKTKIIIIDNFDYINVSSTEIRQNINNEHLNKRVRKYIIDNKLYGTGDKK